MTAALTLRHASAATGRRSIVRELFRGSPSAVISLIVIVAWIVVAFTWQWYVPYDPYATSVGKSLAGPSLDFLLGTDNLGRDVFSRLLAGSTDVLSIAPPATLITMVVGVTLGLLAAYLGGIADRLIMRFTELLLVIPGMVLAVMIVSALGSSRGTLLFVISLFGIPPVARTIRAAALREVTKDYVTAARMRGESVAWITGREVLPNLIGPIIVETTVRLSWAFFSAASLSFLGMSLQPPSAEWGLTITGQRTFLQVQPWAALAPTLALASLMVAVGILANRLSRVVSGREF